MDHVTVQLEVDESDELQNFTCPISTETRLPSNMFHASQQQGRSCMPKSAHTKDANNSCMAIQLPTQKAFT